MQLLFDRAQRLALQLFGRPEFRAASISVLTFGFSQILRIVSSLIMTRLLMPEMFGVIALVLSVQLLLGLVSDFGIRQMVIQTSRGDDPEFLNTAWTIEFLRGVAIWLMCLVLAVTLYVAGQMGWLSRATAWGAADLPVVLAVSSATVIISGFRSTKLLTATRQMQLGKLSAIEVLSQICGLAFMIGWGFFYGTIWALVVGALAASLLNVVLSHSWLPGHRNRLAWDRSALAALYASGRWLMLSSFAQAFSSNIDKFLLAAIVAPSYLGLYSLALNLVLMVEVLGGRLISDVAYPSICEAARSNRDNLASHLFKLRLPIDACYLIASGAMCSAGYSLIDLLYDDRYLEAGPILQILSFSLFFSRFAILPFSYMAIGESKLTAATSSIRLFVSVLLIFAGYHLFGQTGAIVGIALSGSSVMLATFWFNRRLGLNNFRYELTVLPIWIVGYVAGLGLAYILTATTA